MENSYKVGDYMEKDIIFLDTNVFGRKEKYDFEHSYRNNILAMLNRYSNIEVWLPSIVVEELKKWGKWYLELTGVDGFRLDAVKHIKSLFMAEWIKEMKEIKQIVTNHPIEKTLGNIC